LNQPYLRVNQSAFTNFSIFDRPYLEALFGGKEYPDGSFVIDEIDNIIEYNLRIFNRYGEMIFQTNDIEDAWDCTYKGEPVMQGVYTWSVEYRHNDAPNRLEREQGTFMIYN
jgi:gliding motility-associated-like protein